MSNLEQELSIPSDAFLPPSGSATLSNHSSSISISQGTSIHSNSHSSSKSKFILVGRQASTADIRIDHKSISRKHAVFYCMDRNNNNDGSSKTTTTHMILRDLGGKHGCLVNGNKVPANSELLIQNGDRVQFGKVREQTFTVELQLKGSDNVDDNDGDSIAVINEESTKEQTVNENQLDRASAIIEHSSDDQKQENKTDNDNDDDNDKPVLTGRAAREAEIASMMASLDQAPSYTKYNHPDPNTYTGTHIDTNTNTGTESNTNTNAASIVTKSQGSSSQEQKQVSSIAKQLKIPITSQISLSNPSTSSSPSIPTSVALDPSGSRIIVGSSDTTLRLYDFNGMDLSARPHKIVTVQDGHSIVQAVFSSTGDRMIVGTTSAQPMVLDRDGHEIIEFNKGDMYVTDMAHTDGHVAQITGVDWGFERDIVVTSSLDGSVRLWNLTKNKTKFQKLCSGKEVYRIKSSVGKRTTVTCVVMAPGGREFACGTSCGTIQIWSTLKISNRPDRVVYGVHEGKPIHSLSYSYDGRKLSSRCMGDDRVLVWDARRLSRTAKPMAVCEGLPGLYEYVNSAFSPDGKLLCAGTSIKRSAKDTFSSLKFYRIDGTKKSPMPILEVDVAKGLSIINVIWHSKINQIVASLSDGSLRVFYDSKWSIKGAKLPVAKGLRKTDDLTLLLNSRAPQGSASVLGEIKTPHSLPIFRDNTEKPTKRKREKDRQDPIKSKRPDLPGTGIKVSEGTSANMNFQQSVLTSAIAKNKNIAGKDPREELFKYSAEEKYSMGDRVLAEKTVEEEEEEMK
uniref:FHA domain-containing protein n=1 Tax=Chaetoceros debilis TaxID=122233 RepID=A0A7S3QJ26_9STRA|mmetsp:Transcript_18029/g.27365  ORF Transcript_18029/g.27365 Transcript_18029/m.27365 type:complete len:792 (+) Transcript_18029:91-2466(+)|eukprot:CAMPEP_0194119828 /NCGR_PEP_ID=MMETSP0150-20130528/40940_1 /TAXON_ID=122233 /ORGANISM="Chaetoceros debilis, Strain MM31A-1" /LENGTH=791 /DNA_ID=CAMNT_0038811665 /DNA_START=73 /DNA_END=2448 /DNA_ORIENTATION=+